MSFCVFFLCIISLHGFFFFFSSRRRHTRYWRDWSSDVCSSDLAAKYIPSVGEAFGQLGNKADIAFKRLQTGFGGEGRGAADTMARAILKIGDAFAYVGSQAEAIGGPVNEFLITVGKIGDGIGVLIAKADFLKNFTSPMAMFSATLRDIEILTTKFNELRAKTGSFLDISDPPKFLQNTIREIEKILGLIDRVIQRAGTVGSKVDQMNAANALAAEQRRLGGGG